MSSVSRVGRGGMVSGASEGGGKGPLARFGVTGDQSRAKRSLRDLVVDCDWVGVDERETGREEERRTRSRSNGRSSGGRQGAIAEVVPLCESERGIVKGGVCGREGGERVLLKVFQVAPSRSQSKLRSVAIPQAREAADCHGVWRASAIVLADWPCPVPRLNPRTTREGQQQQLPNEPGSSKEPLPD